MANNAKIIYLLADVHLMPDSQHPINQKFFSFLQNQATQAQEIYFLGDLFETWTGDDIGLEDYADEIAELRKLANKGIKTYLCYGNRDFLMRKEFWQATGIEQLEDITYKNLLGHECILMHGDQLCTLDTGYQKMRKIFRNRLVQNIFLTLPKSLRNKIAEKLRSKRTTPLPVQNVRDGFHPVPKKTNSSVQQNRSEPVPYDEQNIETCRERPPSRSETNQCVGTKERDRARSLQSEGKNINPKYDVNPAEVEKLFNPPLPVQNVGNGSEPVPYDNKHLQNTVLNLIHGHTHTPNHEIINNNHRWTVSDWDNTPQIIQITPEEIKLIEI